MTAPDTDLDQQKTALWSLLVLLVLNAPDRHLRIPGHVLTMTSVAEMPPMVLNSEYDQATGDLVITVKEDPDEAQSVRRLPGSWDLS